MLLESFHDGRAFFETAHAITQKKPIVLLKTGRGEAAQRGAASHSAALAGDTAVADAAMAQAGIITVRDGLTLLDTASALDRQGAMTGDRVAIISNSGGTGVELADLLEDGGLRVPTLSEPLRGRRSSICTGPPKPPCGRPMRSVSDASGEKPPIGRPVFNVEVQLLDPEGRPVAAGEAGELYIGGAWAWRADTSIARN